MAVIKPFHAIMPAQEYSSRVAALPYDVYDREEARAAALKDPLSFLNIDRPETQFEEGHDMYAPDVYLKAADMLQKQEREGVFVEDPAACYYVYRLTMNGRGQTGIVACASIDDYRNEVIRKHENTREDKLQDRIRHVDVTGMQTGPIFLAYRHNDDIAQVTERVCAGQPMFDFVSEDGIGHQGWRIDDAADLETIRAAFETMDRIYIADGHHRAESAVRAGLMRRDRHPSCTGEEEFNFFLSVLFPDDELMIMDYNRVVHDLAGMELEDLLARLRQVCTMRACAITDAPAKKGEFQIYVNGQWYLAQFRTDGEAHGEAAAAATGEADPVATLDVSVLQNRILAPMFGIEDPKTDERIEFVGGIRGSEELEKRADKWGGIAFRMYPTSIGELMEVADAGALMPPKSTWFEPKLRSGLFLHRIGQ